MSRELICQVRRKHALAYIREILGMRVQPAHCQRVDVK